MEQSVKYKIFGKIRSLIEAENKLIKISVHDKEYLNIKRFLTYKTFKGGYVRFYIEESDGVFIKKIMHLFYMRYYKGADIEIPRLEPFRNSSWEAVVRFLESALGYELMPHQVEVLRKFHEKHPARAYFTLATGSGKSLILAGIALMLVAEGYRVCYVVNNTQILKQFYTQYMQYILKTEKFKNLVVAHPNNRDAYSCHIAITTPASLRKYISGDVPIFLIVDEAHLIHNEILNVIKTMKVAGVLCATATAPNKMLKRIEKIDDFQKLYKYFQMTYFNEIEVENKQSVLQLLVKKLKVYVKDNFNSGNIILNTDGNKVAKMRELLQNKILFELDSTAYLGRFQGIVLSNTIAEETLKILDELIKRIGNEKIIVFTKFLFKLRIISNYLREKGYKVLTIYGGKSEGKGFKETSLVKEFIRNPAYHILVTSPISREGVDYKGIKYMIMVDVYISPTSFTQLVGRILRTNDEEKSNVYMITNVNFDVKKLTKQLGLPEYSYIPEIAQAVTRMLAKQEEKQIANLKNLKKNFQIEIDVENI
ncbi:MAG: DEAD/DEAH box helicase family protein [Candidatus Micrarchaeota archaeon]|nr:DEAD/DEAH box helicase family protein [Candidatus Micrarchaeota archaeon]